MSSNSNKKRRTKQAQSTRGTFSDSEHAEIDRLLKAQGSRVAAPDDPIYSEGATARFFSHRPTSPAPTATLSADDYYQRGNAKGSKGDFPGALADYTRAVDLNPNDPRAYNMRGFTRQATGDINAALTDYNRAIRIDPKFADAYRNRGVAYFLKRDWTRAVADFRSACKHGPEDVYPQLFLWLVRARRRQQKAADKTLAAFLAKRFDISDWPSQIGSFLLGRLPEPEFLAAADSPNSDQQLGQRCEAYFYAGMKRLIANEPKAAASHFKKSLATKQTGFAEYQCAGAELKALSPMKIAKR